jgi:hypothetical protein
VLDDFQETRVKVGRGLLEVEVERRSRHDSTLALTELKALSEGCD